MGITETSQETRRDHWGGNVIYKLLFDSVNCKHFNQVKMWIVVYITTPAIPSLFW